MGKQAQTNQKNLTFGSPMESLWTYGKGGTRAVKHEPCNCPTAEPEKLPLTDHLMEQIITRDNLNRAYLRVTTNKGSAGIDSMTVDDLLIWCRENGDKLKESLTNGTYKPFLDRGLWSLRAYRCNALGPLRTGCGSRGLRSRPTSAGWSGGMCTALNTE